MTTPFDRVQPAPVFSAIKLQNEGYYYADPNVLTIAHILLASGDQAALDVLKQQYLAKNNDWLRASELLFRLLPGALVIASNIAVRPIWENILREPDCYAGAEELREYSSTLDLTVIETITQPDGEQTLSIRMPNEAWRKVDGDKVRALSSADYILRPARFGKQISSPSRVLAFGLRDFMYRYANVHEGLIQKPLTRIVIAAVDPLNTVQDAIAKISAYATSDAVWNFGLFHSIMRILTNFDLTNPLQQRILKPWVKALRWPAIPKPTSSFFDLHCAVCHGVNLPGTTEADIPLLTAGAGLKHHLAATPGVADALFGTPWPWHDKVKQANLEPRPAVSSVGVRGDLQKATASTIPATGQRELLLKFVLQTKVSATEAEQITSVLRMEPPYDQNPYAPKPKAVSDWAKRHIKNLLEELQISTVHLRRASEQLKSRHGIRVSQVTLDRWLNP